MTGRPRGGHSKGYVRRAHKNPIVRAIRAEMVRQGLSLTAFAERFHLEPKSVNHFFIEESTIWSARAVRYASCLDLQLTASPSSETLLSQTLSAISLNRFDSRELATLAATSATALSHRLASQTDNGSPRPGKVTGS